MGELREEAQTILERLAELWRTQRNRVEHYGDEAGLEHAFIQAVVEELARTLKDRGFSSRNPAHAR